MIKLLITGAVAQGIKPAEKIWCAPLAGFPGRLPGLETIRATLEIQGMHPAAPKLGLAVTTPAPRITVARRAMAARGRGAASKLQTGGQMKHFHDKTCPSALPGFMLERKQKGGNSCRREGIVMANKPESWSAWLRFGGAVTLAVLLTALGLDWLNARILEPNHCSPLHCPHAEDVLLPLLALLFGWLAAVVTLAGMAARHRPWR